MELYFSAFSEQQMLREHKLLIAELFCKHRSLFLNELGTSKKITRTLKETNKIAVKRLPVQITGTGALRQREY